MLLLFEVKIVLKTCFRESRRSLITIVLFWLTKNFTYQRFCQTNKHMIILRASDWFFDTSGLEQKTAAVAKRVLVEFPFARSTVSRTMSAADFDSLDFITFKSDASRGKVRDFSLCRILCNV